MIDNTEVFMWARPANNKPWSRFQRYGGESREWKPVRVYGPERRKEVQVFGINYSYQADQFEFSGELKFNSQPDLFTVRV